MIGTGALASGAGSVLVVAALLGGGGPDPSASRHADQLVRDRSRAALEAIDALAAALAPALDAARDGTSLAVQGDEPPGPRLTAAATAVEAATANADAARRAVAALEAARRARDPGTPGLPAVPGTGELEAIAGGLRAAAPAADAVVELRRRAARLLEAVDRALAALVDRRHADARAEVEAARAEHEVLRASTAASDVLPVWLETTDAMITVVTRLIDATEADDREAAATAAAEFAALAEDATVADRALRIAIAEGAGSATRAAVQRLAVAVGSVQELRAAIGSGTTQP